MNVMLLWSAKVDSNISCCDCTLLALAHPALVLLLFRDVIPEDLKSLPYGLLAYWSDQGKYPLNNQTCRTSMSMIYNSKWCSLEWCMLRYKYDNYSWAGIQNTKYFKQSQLIISSAAQTENQFKVQWHFSRVITHPTGNLIVKVSPCVLTVILIDFGGILT